MRDPFPDPTDADVVDDDAADAGHPARAAAAGAGESMRAAVDAMAAPGHRAVDHVRTGFPSIDTLLGGGLRRGDLIVLCGEVGVGKSAMAIAIALRANEAGFASAFFSGEMRAERLVERALAIEGRVRVDDLRRGTVDDATRATVDAAAARLRDRLPWFAELPDGGLADVDAAFGVLGMPELVVIDPLHWLADGAMPLDESLATVMRALKAMAIRHDVAVLVTTHLPAMIADRPDPRPTLDDLGALGSIKQVADVVLGIFRQEMHERASDVEGATELLVLKNRNGATGYADLYFYKQWMRFEDMLEPDR